MSKEKIVGLASGSHRRRVALEQIPNIEIINVGGGDESNTDDLLNIAICKIMFAYPTILKNCREISGSLFGVIAADTNTLIGIIENEKKQLKGKNKPKNSFTTREHFLNMSHMANRYGFGYYEAVAASAFQGEDGTIGALETTKVTLDPQRIVDLSSATGFEEYLEVFENFYKGETYGSFGLPPIKTTDISAGISLPVLVKMGAVDNINGTDLKKDKLSEIELTLKQALLNVAVGFSPKVLEKIHPDAISYLINWQWTNQVVDEILSK